MSIRVTCPNGHTLNVRDSCAGKVGLCPVCKAKIKVPMPSGGMSEDDIISVLGPHKPRAAASGDSLSSSTSSIFSSREKSSDPSYSGIGGSSGLGLGGASGVGASGIGASGIGASSVGMGGSHVDSSAPPKKACTHCHREISSGTHICPFCRTYIANLSDL